jgi:enoyl-CoA hydratase
MHLKISVESGIAIVRMDPSDEGELEHSVFLELRDALLALGGDANIGALVLTGAGENFYPGVGPDRSRRLAGSSLEVAANVMLTQRQSNHQILDLRKPIVSAVAGSASGIGAQYALLCDAVVVANTATFGDTHVGHGLAAGDGGTIMWPLLVGPARARALLLRGRVITAAEADQLGLVDELVEPEQLLAVALGLAREIAALPSVAYMATKQALNNWWRQSSIVSSDFALAFEIAGIASDRDWPTRTRSG